MGTHAGAKSSDAIDVGIPRPEACNLRWKGIPIDDDDITSRRIENEAGVTSGQAASPGPPTQRSALSDRVSVLRGGHPAHPTPDAHRAQGNQHLRIESREWRTEDPRRTADSGAPRHRGYYITKT
ncbi:hypothetical protein DENSPDRAFT_707531 [Dentipellis sp. KUC8613]|nr:hypothetical protein DENSPDRAFT_707531 [Dentipellis sp. KUC8613]